MTADAPLADWTYEPAHPPVNGLVPDVVEKWGARSQVRWFERFKANLKPNKATYWDRFYCVTTAHKGSCCPSCADDGDYYGDLDGRCCCKAIRAEDP